MTATATISSTERVGHYALYDEIASGGMATVCFGRFVGAIGFARPVAIKRLHPHFARDAEVRGMFVDEARLAARIRHPNVVPTLDVVSEGGELLIVMEYVQGEPLSRLMRAAHERREHVPLRIIRAVMTNVLHGLHAAHEAKSETGLPLEIVHRDVSPQNVIVGVDGVARVLDFGIARAAVRGETTRQGVIKGKVAYMAPEQFGGKHRVSRRADLYASACVMWEMLAGRRLYERQPDPALVIVEKLMREVKDPPSAHREGVPRSLDAIVMKGLHKEPEHRFASARAMALAVERSGDSATQGEVGAWVEWLAGETLAARARKLAEIEKDSASVINIKAEPRWQPDAIDVLLEESHEETPTAIPIELARPARPDLAHQVAHLRGASTIQPPGARAPIFAPAALPVQPFVPQPAALPSIDKTPATLAPSQATIRPALEVREAPSRLRTIASAAAVGVALAMGVVLGARGWSMARSQGSGSSAAAPLLTAAPAAIVTPTIACPEGMIAIAGGKLRMGLDDGLPPERPVHEVLLSPFCIDALETTTGDYGTCAARGACAPGPTTNDWEGISDHERRALDPLCTARDGGANAKLPMNCVSWGMAQAYCRARGARLPTEAEWELAARGVEARRYPWGDAEPTPVRLSACGRECVKWGKDSHFEEKPMFLGEDGYPTLAPVGSFPGGASPYGVMDMAGNVAEWVLDWYGEYPSSPVRDPSGPRGGDARVLRGGSWDSGYAANVRATFRQKAPPSTRSYAIGFRCAK